MLTVLQDTPQSVLPTVSETNRTSPNFAISSNKVFFISLGCPRNLVDTEVMIGILLKAGYEACTQLEEADFIVINTCGFLESARQESLDTIQEALRQKKQSAKVVIAGCMVQSHSELIKERFPEIHSLLGSGDVTKILAAVEAKEHTYAVSSAKSFLEVGEIPRVRSTPKHYAYVKIAEGCKKQCAFCKIPSIKGPLKSKSEEQIVKEISILLNDGVSEIILIAQDLGDYAKDRGYKKSDGLVQLLQTIFAKESRDFSLRLLYLYPDEITDDLIACIKNEPRIVRYLDMPMQHVNDAMLRSMHRKTTKKEIIDTYTKLKKELPEIVIRTSLMVGFPGETPDQFQELCDFVQKYPLDNIGIFIFSKEEGTYAASMDNQVSEHIKEKRLKKLAQIQQKISKKRLKRLAGKTLDVVIEGYHPDSKLLLKGRYYGQCPEIDGCVIINDCKMDVVFGRKYPVRITENTEYDLVGSIQ